MKTWFMGANCKRTKKNTKKEIKNPRYNDLVSDTSITNTHRITFSLLGRSKRCYLISDKRVYPVLGWYVIICGERTQKGVNNVYTYGLTFDMLKMKTINQWFKWNAKKLTNYPCQNCYEVLNCDTRVIYTRKTRRILNKMQTVPFRLKEGPT